MKDDLLGSISFLTVFGRGTEPTENSKYWFFVPGILIGLLAGIVWYFTYGVFSHDLSSALTVLCVVVVTGAIHFDGLADAADGLLAHLDQEKRFEVMAQPQVGVFAVMALVMALLLTWVSLAALIPNYLFLIAVFTLSRELSALSVEVFNYARVDGIASSFRSLTGSLRGAAILIIEVLGSLALFGFADGVKGVLVGVTGVAVWLMVTWRANRLLGGYTGDVLGASIVLVEAICLAVGAMMFL